MNGIISIPNFMKIYQAVQKLLVGYTQTDKQTYWWFDKHTFNDVERYDLQMINLKTVEANGRGIF
jgi:hypothetical protein